MNNDLQEALVLENGKEYLILDRIMYQQNFYLLLVCSAENDDDTLIQKEVLENNELKLKPIESEEEFNAVLQRFSIKNVSP